MGKSKKQVKQGVAKTADSLNDADFAHLCQQLALKYAMYDKEEWWWIMDESVQLIGERLQRQGYCAIDHFLPAAQWKQFRAECTQCYKDDSLKLGGLVNARKEGEEAKYSETSTRSDLIGWFNSDTWKYGHILGKFEIKVNTLVSELMQFAPELKAVNGRSLTMVACYPGNGTRYAKHVDNDGKHPLCCKRVLTALMYLNEWQEGDGGELVVYDPDDMRERTRIPPLGGRVLLFWSDKRIPHEVLPSKKLRFSATAWLLDTTLGVEGSAPPPAKHVSLSSVVTPLPSTKITAYDAPIAGAVETTTSHHSSTMSASRATEPKASHDSSTTTSPPRVAEPIALRTSSTWSSTSAQQKAVRDSLSTNSSTIPHDSSATAPSRVSERAGAHDSFATASHEVAANLSPHAIPGVLCESSATSASSVAAQKASREPAVHSNSAVKSTAPLSQYLITSQTKNTNDIRLWADSEDSRLLQVEVATMPTVDQSDTHIMIRGMTCSLCFHGRTERIRYSKKKKLLSVYLETPCAASVVEEVNSAHVPEFHHGVSAPISC